MVVTDEVINRFIVNAYDEETTLKKVVRLVNQRFGTDLSYDAVRGRYRRHKEKFQGIIDEPEGFNPEDYNLRLKKVWGSPDKPQFSYDVLDPKPTEEDFQAFLERIKDISFNHVTPVISPSNEILAVVQISDAHINALTIDGADPSSKFDHVANRIMSELQARGNIGRICFPIGNDFGHVDNSHNTTNAGTNVASNMTYQQSILFRTELLIRFVNRLLTVAPVDLPVVPGNHDTDDSVWLGAYVEGYYKDNPHVTVDNMADSPRKFYNWGRNVFMMAHGEKNLNQEIMAFYHECPKEYLGGGNIRVEVWHGHIHTWKQSVMLTNEQSGVLFRWFPSLAGVDQWHKWQGYVGNRKGAVVQLYDTYDWQQTLPIFI